MELSNNNEAVTNMTDKAEVSKDSKETTDDSKETVDDTAEEKVGSVKADDKKKEPKIEYYFPSKDESKQVYQDRWYTIYKVGPNIKEMKEKYRSMSNFFSQGPVTLKIIGYIFSIGSVCILCFFFANFIRFFKFKTLAFYKEYFKKIGYVSVIIFTTLYLIYYFKL